MRKGTCFNSSYNLFYNAGCTMNKAQTILNVRCCYSCYICFVMVNDSNKDWFNLKSTRRGWGLLVWNSGLETTIARNFHPQHRSQYISSTPAFICLSRMVYVPWELQSPLKKGRSSCHQVCSILLEYLVVNKLSKQAFFPVLKKKQANSIIHN